MMYTSKLIWTFAAGLALAAESSSMAGSTFYYNADESYQRSSDSPFAGSSLHLENFEDGLLNTVGVTADHGKVKGPGSTTDSVDKDDGKLNGTGSDGHSFSSGSSKSITFNFSSASQGLPTMAGLVWTDGHRDSTVTFKAWDSHGDLIGKITAKLGDLVRGGTTAEDRFMGLVSDKGISKIRIVSNYAGFEIDHLQFGYGYTYGFAVVPLPPAALLGLAGLVGLSVRRRSRWAI